MLTLLYDMNWKERERERDRPGTDYAGCLGCPDSSRNGQSKDFA